MRENDMHKIFEPLTPTKQQGEQMWAQIEQRGKQIKETEKFKPAGKRSAPGFGWQRIAVAVAALLVLWGTGAAVNAATDGGVVRQLKEWFQPAAEPEAEQDIVNEAVELGEEGLEVYAPDILSMDKQYLIFGNLRGILVYDLRKDKLLGSIDTQKIDCAYFGTDAVYTRLWKEDDTIYLWNEKGERLQGKVHCFRIREVEKQDKKKEKIVSAGTMENGKEICEKYHSRKQKEGIQDTFRKLSGWAESEKKLEFLLSGSRTMYSENSYETENADGEKVLNFLTLQGEKYRLYQCNMQTKQIQVRKLYLTAVERKDRTLPAFEYTGDNAALAAIISYQQEKWIQSGNEGQFVPEYVIFKEVQKGNEYLVFGNFYEEGYRKVGNLLQSLSGGEMPACFHLKKEGEHYQVVKVDRAGDGAYYAKGIRKFTGDYPGLYERFMESEELARLHKKARKKYLRMYVKEHDLEVKGYKDFGWDPEDIDGDR